MWATEVVTRCILPNMIPRDVFNLMLTSKTMLKIIDREDIWKSQFIGLDKFRHHYNMDTYGSKSTSCTTGDLEDVYQNSSWKYVYLCRHKMMNQNSILDCFEKTPYSIYIFHDITTYSRFSDSLIKNFGKIVIPLSIKESWAVDGLVDHSDPGIYIHSLDQIIQVPYNGETLKNIISSDGSHAPMGRGSETIMDRKSRKCWQIGTDKFTITNPEWLKEFSTSDNSVILSEIRSIMMPSTLVIASLYKLLIYEAGDFFNMHVDTQRSPSMFGTLCVTLPVTTTGGELIIYHGKEKKIFPISSSDISYVAFYTDCPHEIKEIKSGYRISLIYNLLSLKPNGPSIASFKGAMPSIVGFKASMPSIEFRHRCLMAFSHVECRGIVWILHYKYVKKSLDPKYLKGCDYNLYTEMLKIFKGNNNVEFTMENVVIHSSDKVCRDNYIAASFIDDDIKIDDKFSNTINEEYIWLNPSVMSSKQYQEMGVFDSGNEGIKPGYLYHTTILKLSVC